MRTESREWGPDLDHGAGSLFLRKRLALAFPGAHCGAWAHLAAFHPCPALPHRGQHHSQRRETAGHPEQQIHGGRGGRGEGNLLAGDRSPALHPGAQVSED